MAGGVFRYGGNVASDGIRRTPAASNGLAITNAIATATYGTNGGADASIVIPAVATITVTKGIITSVV